MDRVDGGGRVMMYFARTRERFMMCENSRKGYDVRLLAKGP